jgi:hypothetical protein
MEFTYRNRKHIARINLIPLVFILLFTLNFKILGGTYSEDQLKKIKKNQSKELEYGTLSNTNNKVNLKIDVEIKQLLDTDFSDIIIDCALLSFIPFIWIYRSELFCNRRDTLVSLCVRMDD